MVILLNQGNRNILESVFWYKPSIIPNEQLRLGHPSLWSHSITRMDETRVDSLALLSCHSGDC